MKRNNTSTIVLQNDAPSKSGGLNLTVVLIVLGLAGGGYYLYSKGKADDAAKGQSSQLQDDIFTKQASEFKKLIGLWYQFANNAEIIKLAKQVTSWAKVNTAYAVLYKGESLEESIRKALNDNDYKNFIFALNQKGVPANEKGVTITPAPAPTGLIKGKSLIKINNTANDVLAYKDTATYGTGKFDFKFYKGLNYANLLFLDSVQANYTNTGKVFSALMYKVQIVGNKSIYWVRAADFVKQASAPALKALGSYNFGVKVA
jgi:hypothetical protein